jgi:hypothetical protein
VNPRSRNRIPEEQRPSHEPRLKFDNLLTDRRHYRGDLRLISTAVRKGWIKSDEDRRALIERLSEMHLKDNALLDSFPDLRRCLLHIRGARIVLEMDRQNQRRKWAHGLYGEDCWMRPPGYTQIRGRYQLRPRAEDLDRLDISVPRVRAHVREAQAAGRQSISVKYTDYEGRPQSQAVRVAIRYSPVVGPQPLFLCPDCDARRKSLFLAMRGYWACRVCLELTYGRHSVTGGTQGPSQPPASRPPGDHG